jgi:hypothetical protein
MPGQRFGTFEVARSYDVAPDGKRFLFFRGVELPPSPPSQLILVENWIEELKRFVPSSR